MDLLHFWVVFFFGNFQDHKIARLQLKFELLFEKWPILAWSSKVFLYSLGPTKSVSPLLKFRWIDVFFLGVPMSQLTEIFLSLSQLRKVQLQFKEKCNSVQLQLHFFNIILPFC